MRLIYVLLLLLVFSSCSPKFSPYAKILKNPITIGTEGVVIEAEDGSFKWEYGKNYDLTGINIQTHEWSNINSLNLKTDDFARLDKQKGIKVSVYTPYQDKPLYGFLEINSIYQPCIGTSPETRSYYIQLPKAYVDAALDGKISVVYESYKCSPGQYIKLAAVYGYNVQKAAEKVMSTWVLWLSDRPL
ncbi:MAG: hypothetical protein RQ735_11030 [Flavobacteriaceae bacterium]|nr:hypothetical protein [Flavobacteriaceae bacterium]